MKRVNGSIVVLMALAFCFALAVPAMAQTGPRGMGPRGNGPGEMRPGAMGPGGNGPGGNGPQQAQERIDVLSGNPVTVAGTVSEVGQGLKIDTGVELVTVYGIGPEMFWEEADVERPNVGDEVSVDGYEVTFSDGSVKIIASSVTVGGNTVQLIDGETGLPLWRKGPNPGGERPEPVDILTGEPVAVSGVVSEIGGGGLKPERINVLSGNPVTVAGTVSEVGQGLKIDTGGEVVTVYGIGPARYWEEAGAERPNVGEAVSVDGYEVTFSDGSVKIIAASATVGGNTVQLIDMETGLPLWRKAPNPDGEPPDGAGIPIGEPMAVPKIGGRDGLKIDTGTEILTVYGIGPLKYWEEQEVGFPEVGDTITVNGYKVTFNDGAVRIIAMSATVNGTSIQLLDPETGKPLWPKRPL